MAQARKLGGMLSVIASEVADAPLYYTCIRLAPPRLPLGRAGPRGGAVLTAGDEHLVLLSIPSHFGAVGLSRSASSGHRHGHGHIPPPKCSGAGGQASRLSFAARTWRWDGGAVTGGELASAAKIRHIPRMGARSLALQSGHGLRPLLLAGSLVCLLCWPGLFVCFLTAARQQVSSSMAKWECV